MRVSLVGVNHRTAPVAILEKVSISTEQLQDCLSLLRHYVPHGLILSTCNRTEVYTTSNDGKLGIEASMKFLKVYSDMSDVTLLRHVYIHQDESVVEQLFKVACGLDSMVVGEFEVLGQVGQALEAAERAKMVNLPLRHIFQSAIRTARLVREKTGISQNALSISSVAIDLAERSVGDLAGSKIVVIGAGEAGRLVAKVAKERGVSKIVVVSRTKARASTLAAALGGIPANLQSLGKELTTTNIIVTCAGAPHRLLDVHHVREAMMNRHELPLVIIDIAVPRNTEPSVSQVNNVFLYDIDDLTEISNRNRQQREGEIQMATEIVAVEVARFATWWQTLGVRPIVSALMKRAEGVRRKQLDKTLSKLPSLSNEERDRLDAMTKSIVTKILRDPISHLKTNTDSREDYIEVISELFHLNTERQE
ncbi:glutamyl-tRNA reductase [Chloroflexota bacterium]